LSDPQKRAAYDQYGHAAFDPRAARRSRRISAAAAASTIRSTFSAKSSAAARAAAFLKAFRRRPDPSGPQRGDDLRYDWKSRSKRRRSAAKRKSPSPSSDKCDGCDGAGMRNHGSKIRTCGTCGGRGQVLTSRGIFSIAQTCPHCKGAGAFWKSRAKNAHGDGKRERTSKIKLRIPPAWTPVRACAPPATARPASRGGPAGDLYVFLQVKPHEIFQRDGDDLLCEVPVSFVQATLGAEIEVPTLKAGRPSKSPPARSPARCCGSRGAA
jgi:molecular chaperone DnaJ